MKGPDRDPRGDPGALERVRTPRQRQRGARAPRGTQTPPWRRSRNAERNRRTRDQTKGTGDHRLTVSLSRRAISAPAGAAIRSPVAVLSTVAVLKGCVPVGCVPDCSPALGPTLTATLDRRVWNNQHRLDGASRPKWPAGPDAD
jgi:hypothetical protein